MDVDSVIARHRARLDEHRKYLDSSTAGTGGFLTSPDANSSSLLQTTTVHVADESVSSPLPVKPINEARVPSSFSSPPVLTTQKHDGESGNRDDLQRCRSADDTKEEKRMQRRRELYINQTLALQAADAAYRKREAQQHRSSEGPAADDGKSNDTNESRRACSGPVAFYGYTSTQERLDEESRFFGRQLKAAGRYYVSRPDAMYTKTKLWLEGRDRSLQQLKHERMLNTLNECSFNPRLSTPPSDPRRARSMRATSYFRDDPGVAAHLERLDEARQQRVEAERRLRGKEAGTWQNRLTVPKEFEFARRVTAIPSLRRPFVSAVPLHDDNGVGDEEEGAHENNAHAGAQQGSERGAAPPAECQPEKAEDMPSIRVPGGVHEKDEGVATTTAAVDASVDDDAATPTTAAMPPQLKVVVARLEEQLAEKDQMLQQQKGEIASLRRQLEVVRATVRRLSLQDVAPGEAGR
ncbi:hypothetical protein DQ04_06421010 [Trypanosoma grayi]|uniref:hypothetical protein n=1 Tax=Trypanosoma grayi TaxID=71804 RepID=UPI0004F4ABF6|nr:hypothetical protein DQ04_06421010 [Trypanosoma grayi]KEG08805.1 hypothetical protein DQ04_06421010 [Trypanosoma grayi]